MFQNDQFHKTTPMTRIKQMLIYISPYPNNVLKGLQLLIIIGFGFFNTAAQDIHFSNNQTFPISINPANTGWFNGDCRASAIYREQWRAINETPYATIGASFEKQHFLYSEQINYGIAVIQDKAGEANFTSNILALAGSYFKNQHGHDLQAGIQIAVINNTINAGNFTYDTQFDLGNDEIFNNEIESGENLMKSSLYIDASAGILWSKQLSEKIIPTMGIAAYHINLPNESVYEYKNNEANVPLRMTIHGTIEYRISDKLRAIPQFIYMNQRKASELLIGGTAEYDINPNLIRTAYAGTQFRYGLKNNYDALAIIAGIRYKLFDFGIAYDYNISQLHIATNSKGAFELSLKYTCRSSKIKNIKVSCERQ